MLTKLLKDIDIVWKDRRLIKELNAGKTVVVISEKIKTEQVNLS